MEAGKRTISDIFNGNRKLVIPFFQRSYVWREEQWARLVEDMEYISSTGKDYFLGSIILKAQQTPANGAIGDIRTVIDGQQRLTTLSIFLKVLAIKSDCTRISDRLFTLNDDSLALTHSQGDSVPYNRVMMLEKLEDINDCTGNIIDAYNYFKEHIDPSKLNIQQIQNKAQFVGIDLLFNEDEQQIFDTINSLGVKLTTGELLKNYFFNRDSLTEYENLWKPIFDADDECREFWDQAITSGRLKRSNIEAFFNAFLQIQVQNSDLGVSAEDKALYRRSEGLFNSYKKFINDYVLVNCQNEADKNNKRIQFIENLVAYAKIYRNNFDKSILRTSIGPEPSIERLNAIIYGLDISTVIPYLMFVQKNVSDKDERGKIFNYLESYLMRRLICHNVIKSYSDLFNENLIGNNIVTEEALRAYIEGKDADADLAMPSNILLRKAFHDFIFPNKKATGILYMLESKLRDPNLHAVALLGINSYSLEHLMPKKWRKNWGMAINPENRDYVLLTLGNLAIITSTLNSKISNADWDKKLDGSDGSNGLRTFASGLLTMEKVLASPNWDEETISDRADWLADKAIEAWPSFSSKGEEIAEEGDENDEPAQDTGIATAPETTENRARNMANIDQTSFSIDGQTFYKKGAFVRLIIRKYLESHPDISFAELKRVFPDSLLESGYKFKGLLCTIEDWNNWDYEHKIKRYYVTAPDSIFSTKDQSFYVNTQWTLASVKGIVQIAEREGFTVTTR